jgi:hypothetical protein
VINLLIDRLSELRAEGQGVRAVTLTALQGNRIEARITLSGMVPIGEGGQSCRNHAVTVSQPPQGVTLHGWERPEDVVMMMTGNMEQAEAYIASISINGVARFGSRYLTKF